MWRIELPSTPAALNGDVSSPAAMVVEPVQPAEGIAGTFAGSSAVVVVLAGAPVVVVPVADLVPLLEHAVTKSVSAAMRRGRTRHRATVVPCANMSGHVPDRSIQLVEVSPRDGLQAESVVLSTAAKVELIERIVAAGARRVEVCSFVNPARVPQMADAGGRARRACRSATTSPTSASC